MNIVSLPQGNATRTGTGACLCKDGYRGDECEECTVGYYEHSKNKTYTDCRSK